MPEARNAIDEEAVRWAVRLDAGPLSPEEQRVLDEWLAVNPTRKGALIRARTAWLAIDRVAALAPAGWEPLPPSGAPHTLSQRGWQRRWLLIAGMGGIAAAGIGWYAWPWLADDYVSEVGEVRRLTLADGSTLQLNTATAVRVRFNNRRRELTLERGEALFEVAKDPSRPFNVYAKGFHIAAVGTAFAVRLGSDQIQVTVTEGVVTLSRATAVATEGVQHVNAHHEATAQFGHEDMQVSPIELPAIERRLAWRAGMVAFDGESLREAVDEVNRHSRLRIVIEGADLAAQPVVGMFRASDTKGFAAAAAVAFGAAVQQRDGTIVLSKPAEPPRP